MHSSSMPSFWASITQYYASIVNAQCFSYYRYFCLEPHNLSYSSLKTQFYFADVPNLLEFSRISVSASVRCSMSQPFKQVFIVIWVVCRFDFVKSLCTMDNSKLMRPFQSSFHLQTFN